MGIVEAMIDLRQRFTSSTGLEPTGWIVGPMEYLELRRRMEHDCIRYDTPEQLQGDILTFHGLAVTVSASRGIRLSINPSHAGRVLDRRL